MSAVNHWYMQRIRLKWHNNSILRHYVWNIKTHELLYVPPALTLIEAALFLHSLFGVILRKEITALKNYPYYTEISHCSPHRIWIFIMI